MKLKRAAFKDCLWDIPGEKKFLLDAEFELEWTPADHAISATHRETGVTYVVDQTGAILHPFVEPKEPVVPRPPEDRGAARSTKSRGR
jgi:hypothetical protein